MKLYTWSTQQLARLVPGARVTQPKVDGVYGERVLQVLELLQSPQHAGGWAVRSRHDSKGGQAIATLDPESVVTPYVCHLSCGHPVNYRGGLEQARTCKVCSGSTGAQP